MKPEDKEGPDVSEAFERTMTALFRAPKPTERKTPGDHENHPAGVARV